jgi:hypothetical protein
MASQALIGSNPFNAAAGYGGSINGLESDPEGAAAILQAAQNKIGSVGVCSAGSGGAYNCAGAVNDIVSDAIESEVGGGLSTTQMKRSLDSSRNWTLVGYDPSLSLPGDIIISPTPENNPNNHGHVGIVEVAAGGSIISNSSSTGTVQRNYTASSWMSRFNGKGIPTYIYRKTKPQD